MHVLWLSAVLPLAAASVSRRSGYSVKSEHPVPPKWLQLDRAPADSLLDMRIGLKNNNFKELERQLYEVSSPSNPKYGQHLSPDNVHSLISPAEDTLSEVLAWLEEHGISEVDFSPAHDWIKVSLPVEQVENLLDTEYHTYIHSDGFHTVRTTAWSLPHHLHERISTIQPTNSFFGATKPQLPFDKRSSDVVGGDVVLDVADASLATGDSVETACNVSLVTPNCVRTLYKTINYTPQSVDKNHMAFTNYLGEVNDRSDARMMLQRFRPDAVSEADSFVKISIDGGPINDRLNSTQIANATGIEGNLDTQAMISIGYPTPLISYSTGGSPPFKPDLFTPTDTNEPYLVWLDYILSQPPSNLPSVISTSYGDDEQTVPKDYAEAVCSGFAQLGARGVTLFFSSGDNGIGSDGYCYTNDGKNTSTFLPAFPASCPYVTTVGGTYKFDPEVAVFRNRSGSIYSAGGGFSNYFPRPAYQGDVVTDYINDVVKPLGYDGLYNASGRGYPDVAGQALNFSVYWNSTLRPVSGTSMSSPLIAAVFALVNDALIAAGKPVLGFLNPWIYEKGYEALNDILTGSAYGCDTEVGLPAAKGWDAVTGHGTPDFEKILGLLGVNASSGGWGDAKKTS